MSEKLTRRALRTMRDRWQRDYDRLQSAYGEWAGTYDAYGETMQNLATAIAWIEGVISARREGDKP